jgi:RHS repeat-associated protein
VIYMYDCPPCSAPFDYKFTGKERDAESGNDYFINRYYGSSLGRFMSPDPANWGAIDASPQTWNAYSYVANNPLNATDPDGLDCVYTSGQSSSSVTVTVVRGDCLSDKDNGVYVNGTVDVNSFTYNGRTGDLGFSYTNQQEGSTGVGIDALGRPPSSDPFSYARSVFSQPSLQTAAATMNDPRTYALWFGASATLGYGLYAAGAFEAGGALTTLSGENGLDLIGNRAINQMIGDGQRELLKEFFETGKAPEGLTEKSLQLYKEVAQRAIAAGKDQLGVQAQRLQMITSALK